MTPKVRLAVGTVASVALLAVLVRFVPVDEVVATLAGARTDLLLCVLGLHLVILLLRVHRWAVIAEQGEPLSRAQRTLAFDSLFFSWLANFALPAKAGDLARPLVYAQASGRPYSELLGATVLERVLDLACLGVGFAAAMWLLPTPDGMPDWLRSIGVLAALAAAGVVGGLQLLRRVTRFSEAGDGLRAKVAREANRFRDGLVLLDRPRVLARAVAWSVVIWIIEAFSIGVLIEACHADATASASVAVVVAIALAVPIPSAPGQLGVAQWVSLAILQPYGIPADAAVAVSLLDTATALCWVVPFGLFAMIRRSALTTLREAEPE